MVDKIINFKGIKFYNLEFIELFKLLQKGGVLVAPAASALIDISENKGYYRALRKADWAILDSGLFCILLRFFREISVKKLSGYLFLTKLIDELSGSNQLIYSVDPNYEESKLNIKYLKSKNIKNLKSYIAPMYKKTNIRDKLLLEEISKKRPKYVLINIGGGIQEILGIYLRDNLNYKPIIICTGAAIAFLTKKQAPINYFIDKFYLGWLFRIIHNPSIFLYRTLRSVKLVTFFLR